MNKPRHVTTLPFDDTSVGGRFSGAPYFPMFLGNGRDAMFINCCGSGDGSWEYTPYSSGPISKLHSIGWYKADRRIKRPELGVYGPLIPFLEFSARPLVDGEVLVPGTTEQYFAPRCATLTTVLTQQDNRTGELTELQIETWLHRDGILVEEVHVLAAPSCGLQYGFSVNTPSYGYQNTTIPTVQPESFDFRELSEGRVVRGELAWPNHRAVSASVVMGVRVGQVCRRAVLEQKFVLLEQRTELLHAGDRVTRILTVQDNYEKGPEPEDGVARILRRIPEEGLPSLRQEHVEEWEAYFSSIEMHVPDKGVQFLYDTSRYVLKANHHPSGFHPVGLVPVQWQGAMFWDSALFAEAFQGCGNVRETAAIFGHIQKLIPNARKLAESYGSRGARIEWTLNLRDFSVYEEPVRQFHNNAVWAMAICQWLADSPEMADGEEFLQFAEELLLFLCDEFLKDQQHGTGAWMVGIDESVAFPKTHDTWTIATLLAALRQFDQLCRERARIHHLPSLDEILPALDGLLTENTDEAGVLQSFRGGRIPHMGSLIYDLLPAHPAAEATLGQMTEKYDAERDLLNFRGSSRSAEKGFPWANFWFCRCLARTNRNEALAFFLHATRTCGYFGSLAERIFYHGESGISWFGTAHAALMWALHGMLAHREGNHLYVLSGIDLKTWRDLQVSGLHVGRNLTVALEVRQGRVKTLSISYSGTQEFSLEISSEYFPQKTIVIRHGDNTIISHS